MALDYRIVAFGLLALAGLLAVVHSVTTEQAGPPAATRASVAPDHSQGKSAPPQANVPAADATKAAPAQASVDSAASPPVAALSGQQLPRLPAVQGKAGADAARESSFTHFRVGERNVKRILVDGDKVWIATSAGAIRYSAASDEYKLYDVRSGLLVDSVIFIGRLRDGIVAGTQGGGMAVLDPASDRWENYGAAEGLGDKVVHDVLQAANGDVWIATPSGAYRVRAGALRERAGWERYTSAGTRGGLPSDRVYALAEGRDGDLWLATEAGVARYRKGGWSRWESAKAPLAASEAQPAASAAPGDSAASPVPHPGGKTGRSAHPGEGAQNPDFVISIAVDKAGMVWAGSLGGGLTRFDGKARRTYTVADGLPGNYVFTLHQDAGRGLWIGTNNGLARLKQGKFEVMTTRDGLFANAVFAVASAPQDLWVGGYGGVARIRAAN